MHPKECINKNILIKLKWEITEKCYNTYDDDGEKN